MKNIKTISLIFALAAVIAACQKEIQTNLKFGADTETITMGAEGGSETVHISAEEGWVANSTSTWISISPANGNGSSDCRIIIDTTLLANGTREGTVRFTSKSAEGSTSDIRVIQTGYEKMIVLNKTEVSVPSFDEYKKRYIDIELTSNVEFTADMAADKEWAKLLDYKFTLDRGSRPRTVKLRIRWENNTRPSEREAVLSFKAADGEELSKNDRLVIKQTAAEEIEDSRRGDSLAISWNGQEMGETASPYCYIVLTSKDNAFDIYQNIDSPYSRHITGNFTLVYDEDEGTNTIKGWYDYNAGLWMSDYVITDVTSDSMTWTSATDVCVYTRRDAVPDEIVAGTKAL